jgi:fatty-acyl-CoA synthase
MNRALVESHWPLDPSVPLRHQTIGDLLREAAAAAPDRIALVDGVSDPTLRRSWTYRELLAEAEAVAAALLLRFEPGERVAIWAPNRAEWVILQQGMSLAGLVMVALNPSYRSRELNYVLGQSRASGLFHTDSYRGFDMSGLVAELAPTLNDLRHVISFTDWDAFVTEGRKVGAAALPVVEPSAPVQVQYTSGTTGFPKGALLHHLGVVNASAMAGNRALIADEPVFVNAMPMYHIGGGSVTELGTIAAHGTYVLLPDFDPGLLLELIQAYGGTHTLVVPTMLLALLDHPRREAFDLSTLRVVMSGASTVPAALVTRTKETLDCDLVISFGQTELHGIISQTEPTDSAEDQADTIGRPMPQVEVRISDPETGEVRPIGEQGEICARGYQTMIEYFDLPDATAATIDAEGWLHTGDLGAMDERGYLRITGRLKDMIIRGGMNIYPREIEEVLFTHPDVVDVAVVGVADEQWGERVVAVVRVLDTASPPAAVVLKEFCRERIAAFKSPSEWFVVAEFPLTPSGKVQKFVLRDAIAAGDLTSLA